MEGKGPREGQRMAIGRLEPAAAEENNTPKATCQDPPPPAAASEDEAPEAPFVGPFLTDGPGGTQALTPASREAHAARGREVRATWGGPATAVG